MKTPNPFESSASRPAEKGEARHVSDHPGRDYVEAGAEGEERTRSSGACGPSEPRRPGTGERQAPRREATGELQESDPLIPGEILLGQGGVVINAGLEVTTIEVVNGADRPIQVGSHFHFAEVNAALEFD
ncbi:MAG: urease subunit beta, partial [Gammaproteobacteria bacterium]